ncbi:MAG: carcinine hydrolase/isopenicillin-N N-acyltransferase family protein [Acetobacteraceae bacterium]|nr:carcinine hydrolase/isopenicillin-N N-acyltransferase family protein [Acetobacteraceae bacterium]
MCDTIVALPSTTARGAVLFGKNSDRERNEAQAVAFVPAAEHQSDATLHCTYIDIPQARRTHATLLCRPFWMWGAEMGANEHGVVIGNEAVHAPTPAQQQPALTGMDLLRLGLERGATAAEALDVVIALLERHGQGGNCGYLAPRFYNNAFIIADGREAFVLETVARDWVVQRAAGGRSISNAYSIGVAYDRASRGMTAPEMMARMGGHGARGLTDLQQDAASQGRARCDRSTALLRGVQGRVETADMIAILRDHGTGDPSWHPQAASGRTICMHAADARRGGQTVNSLVSQLHAGHAMHWVTGTAAPCLSIFKPVLFGVPVPAHGPSPAARCDPATLWWRHEQMHRAMLPDLPGALDAIRAERDALEATFRGRIATVMDAPQAERARVVDACWAEAAATEARWHRSIRASRVAPLPAYRAAWQEMDRLAVLG